MEDTPALDLRNGIALDDLPDGAIVRGSVDAEEAILLRRGDAFFAVGAQCTHYHGPLAEGLIVDDTVRCPWHHACFSLRTGEALRAPALDPIACWREGCGSGPASRADGRGIARHARLGGHRRRRCGGLVRRGHASPRRVPGRHYDAQRRRFPAVRPPEPLQGFPGRDRA